jgi:hypothetical protein
VTGRACLAGPAAGVMTGRTTGVTGAMTGRTTGVTGAMTGRTTGVTGAMTGKAAVVAGLGCSANRELVDQGGRAAASGTAWSRWE